MPKIQPKASIKGTGLYRSLIVCSGLMMLALFSAGSLSEESLAHPIEDAKQDYRDGKIIFVAIKLAEETIIPGLKPHQLVVVKERYQVRDLNRRWKTFANIEEQPGQLSRMKRYAIRYNLMLWKLDNSAQSDRFQYRY